MGVLRLKTFATTACLVCVLGTWIQIPYTHAASNLPMDIFLFKVLFKLKIRVSLADTIKTFFCHLVYSGLLCIVGDPWWQWSHLLASTFMGSLVVNLSFPSLGK